MTQCNPSNWEIKAGELGVESYAKLPREFKASLRYITKQRKVRRNPASREEQQLMFHSGVTMIDSHSY